MFIPCSDIYFLEIIAHLSLTVGSSGAFRYKKTSKMSILDAIILNKNGVVQCSSVNVLTLMFQLYTLFRYIFSGSESPRFTESSHQWSFEW